ncbi:ferredoxin [Gordonia alkanivorans]|uniref:ferredoxin n=1 Tax=Gordonia alkanivorans TaxID=84096 RepID=UPI00244AB83D|nr:ferredoxin [Gordonia alkanivorans]MDH3047134.1 ferredoxin [Gordonia alkanivorans]
MKIIVDEDLCQGHGDCVMEAPTVFELGDDDLVVQVLDASPSEDLREEVELAARRCPVNAIIIES